MALTIDLARKKGNGRTTVASLRLARKVAQTIAEWEIVVRHEGRPISAEEFAHYWRDSPATAYRRLAEFRELYDQAQFPHDLMEPLLAELQAADGKASYSPGTPQTA